MNQTASSDRIETIRGILLASPSSTPSPVLQQENQNSAGSSLSESQFSTVSPSAWVFNNPESKVRKGKMFAPIPTPAPSDMSESYETLSPLTLAFSDPVRAERLGIIHIHRAEPGSTIKERDPRKAPVDLASSSVPLSGSFPDRILAKLLCRKSTLFLQLCFDLF